MIEDRIAERFRAAMADEPPLGFDPDDVVTEAGRRLRRRPWRRAERRDGQLPADVAGGTDPVAAQQQRFLRDELFRVLSGIPPRQRAVLVLRYFESLSVAETAEALGCSEGTVKSQTARGLAAMKAAIDPEAAPAALRSEHT